MNISSTGRYYNTTSVAPVILSHKSAPAISQTKGSDTVSVSSEAVKMGQLANKLTLESLLGFEPKTPGRVTIEEIEAHGRQFLADFNNKLIGLLQEKGIDTNTPVELGNGRDGSVVVKNNRTDKAAIEKIFKDQPELRNEFTKINNMLTLAAEAKEAAQFHEAYKINPEAAVAQYAYLFSSDLEGTAKISALGADILFSRVPQGKA